MYVYIYMYVCIYIYVCIYTYIYIYPPRWGLTPYPFSSSASTTGCRARSCPPKWSIYIHICLYIYKYIYMCVCIYTHTQPHTHPCIPLQTNATMFFSSFLFLFQLGLHDGLQGARLAANVEHFYLSFYMYIYTHTHICACLYTPMPQCCLFSRCVITQTLKGALQLLSNRSK